LEYDNIVKFIGLQAKSYTVITADDQQIIRTKGFAHVYHILKNSDRLDALEDLLMMNLKPLEDDQDDNLEDRQSLVLYQRGPIINRTTLLPHQPEASRNKKRLSFVGPRRIIDMENGLKLVAEEVGGPPKLFHIPKPPPPTDGACPSIGNSTMANVQVDTTNKADAAAAAAAAIVTSIKHVLRPKAILATYPMGFCFPPEGMVYDHILRD
jgi:hypothetical protein